MRFKQEAGNQIINWFENRLLPVGFLVYGAIPFPSVKQKTMNIMQTEKLKK